MKACFTAPALALELNQCDGCRANAEINGVGHHRYPDGSLIACTASRYQPEPTDPGYEYRTIALDAERAWKMREPLERALSWPKGSKQEMWWLGAYYAARDASC